MRSPRIDVRSTPLRAIFSAKNLERIWRKKVRSSLKMQALTDGLEHFDFHLQCENECKKLSATILSGDYVPSRPVRVLSEKSKGLCRQIVIPAVPDALVLQCLSDALYKEIKDRAPTARAFFEPQDHRFSKDRERDEYGTFAAWMHFQQALFEFSKEREYVIVTDVANYYDTISYVHLRNVISSISTVYECVLDMLIYVLSHLLWQPDYTPRVEIGLPQMNLDAPRLLAHCLLYELDKYLDKEVSHDFVRFMDDIDIGVDTIEAARKVLRSTDLVLQTRQLRLNAGKTKILTRQEAEAHFRISENSAIDTLVADIEAAFAAGHDTKPQRDDVAGRIRAGIRRRTFDGGNGDKILKRLLTLATRTDAHIAPRDLKEIFLNKSGVRMNVLKYIASTGATSAKLAIVAECVEQGFLVDDAAMIDISMTLVETKIMEKRRRGEQITRIIAACDIRTTFGLYCCLWLKSKYSSSSDLLETIRTSRNSWAPHDHLGRLIGAFAPLFEGSQYEDFLKLLFRSRNPGFRSVLRFHAQLASNSGTFNAMFPILRAANTSKTTGITHAKFLCLISALKNPEATDRQKELLRIANSTIPEDAYYKGLIARTGVQ